MPLLCSPAAGLLVPAFYLARAEPGRWVGFLGADWLAGGTGKGIDEGNACFFTELRR